MSKIVSKFGRRNGHKESMIKNLLISLFRGGYIKTTLAKAYALRIVAEKEITKMKKNDLSTRRHFIGLFFNNKSNHALVDFCLDVIGKVEKDRNGGYLRMIKYSSNRTDCAPMAILQFVDYAAIYDAHKPEIITNKNTI